MWKWKCTRIKRHYTSSRTITWSTKLLPLKVFWQLASLPRIATKQTARPQRNQEVEQHTAACKLRRKSSAAAVVSFTVDSASWVALAATIVKDLFASAGNQNFGHAHQQSVASILKSRQWQIPNITDRKNDRMTASTSKLERLNFSDTSKKTFPSCFHKL